MLFFLEELAGDDPVQVQAMGRVMDGVLLSKEEAAKLMGGHDRVKVERIYLSRKEVSGDSLKLGVEIELEADMFPPLKMGVRALIFISKYHGRFFQRNHLLLENIDNEPYAVSTRDGLWKSEGVSPFIRANTRPYLGQAHYYHSAIRLEAVESDIQASIEAIARGDPVKKWMNGRRDTEFLPDGSAQSYDLDKPEAVSGITAFVYHRARPDEIVAQRHAAMVARLRAFDGPFGLRDAEPPSAPTFTDGGYWTQAQDDARAVTLSGWYAFRGNRVLEDKATDDDNVHYQFNARDARLDYKKLLHDDFKRVIVALDGYRAIWNYSRYGMAYRRGYLERKDAPEDIRTGWPIEETEEYEKLLKDESLDVDGRNNIFTLYPAQYWDAELCQRALGYGPDEVLHRLQDKVPRAERLGEGVYLVLNDDPQIGYDDFLSMNEQYKTLLGLA